MHVGLIGCGKLGATLGGKLLGHDHRLVVHDTNREHAAGLLDRGAQWADSPRDVAADARVIVSALPNPAAVESVFLGEHGPWSTAAPRTIHLEASTVGPECVVRLARAAAAARVRLLDCPISRGPIREGAITTVAWVGGDVNDFGAMRPLLEHMVDRVVYCGSVGQAQITKLINNLIAHSLTVIAGEALALGVKAGASLDLLSAALQHGTGQNRVLDELLPESVFRGDWRPGQRLDLAIKDLGLAADLARREGIDLVALERFRELYGEAERRGWGDRSAHSVIRLIEEKTRVELRSDAEIRAWRHAGANGEVSSNDDDPSG